jgi:hypothetical protein
MELERSIKKFMNPEISYNSGTITKQDVTSD